MQFFFIVPIAIGILVISGVLFKSNKNVSTTKSTEHFVWTNLAPEEEAEISVLRPEITDITKPFPFSEKFLLTKAEYSFWKVLKERCDKAGILICPKVRMEDFITITEMDNREKMSYRGRIKARHIDFLLCDSKLHMLAGVELDDNRHAEENKSDITKNQTFVAIKKPLYRVIMKAGYYEKQVDAIVTDLMIPR